MFHWFGVITNTKGDSLPGWQVECVQLSDGSTVVPIYSDENETPILTASGISNRAKADTSGNYDFFVAEGTYSLRFYDANGIFQRMQRYLPMYGNAPEAAIAAMEDAQAAQAAAEVAQGLAEDAQAAAEAASELAQTTAGGTVYATWADLAAATGMTAGDSAVVFEDAGTHTDPVTSATVNNTGIYIYSASPAGWERVADTEAVKAADSADQAQAWAEGTLPGGAGTKSAKEWAGEADASAASASDSAAFNVPWLGIASDPDNTGAFLVPAFELWPQEQFVWRDGAVRSFASDLTDHGDGSFTLGTVPSGLSAGSTLFIQCEHNFGDAVSGTLFSQTSNPASLAGGYDVAPRLSDGLAFAGCRITNRAAANNTVNLHQFGMSRFAFAVPASGTATYQVDDGIAVVGPTSATYATPTRICVGRMGNNTAVVSGVTIKRVILFAGALSAAQIQAVLDATDLNPIPAAPLTVPKWVPEIVADDGTTVRPLMHPDWTRGLCWFENDVHVLTDIIEQRGTAPNQQWVAKRPPRGLRHTLGWTATTDVDLPAAWQAVPNSPAGQIFQSFNPALFSPTSGASRFQWRANTTGGFPVFEYTCSYTGTTVGNIAGGATPGAIPALDAEYLNGIHRIGLTIPPTGGQSRSAVDARPVGTVPGASSLNAANQRPAYFGWGGFYNGTAYSLPMGNISLVAATIWPRALSATEFRRAMIWSQHVTRPIWVHSDSGGNLGWLRDSILLHAKRAGCGYIPMFRTSRGSQGLTYHNDYIAAWITAYPELADMTFVLNESGLDIANQNSLAGVAQPPLSIRDSITLINTIANRFPENSLVFLEPQTNLAATTGLVKETGTARAGTVNTITLASDATSTSIGSQAVRITAGTGAGQTRWISGYNILSKVATVTPDWTTVPDAASQYRVLSALEYQTEFVEAIAATFPDSFVPTNRLMQSQYATAADYDAAVISGTTPSALREDVIHAKFGTWTPSDSGHYWTGLGTFRKLRDLGLML